MATDYGYRNAAAKPMFVGTKKDNDMPLDARTRVDTIADLDQITFPFVGMIFYVVDEDAYYSVKTLKGEESKPGNPNTFVDNYKIDTYEPFSGGGGGLSTQEKLVIEKLIRVVGEYKTEAHTDRYIIVEPGAAGSLTVVPDDIADDDFDAKTMIKVADANQYGGTFQAGDTVAFEAEEEERLDDTGLIKQVMLNKEHIGDPAEPTIPQKVDPAEKIYQEGALEVVDSDPQEGQILASEVGGAAGVGEHVIKTADAIPEVPARLDTLASMGLERADSVLTIVPDGNVNNTNKEVSVTDAETKSGIDPLPEGVTKLVHLKEVFHYEADPAGTLTVVADDAEPFDPNTQVRVSDAGGVGVGETVKKVVDQPEEYKLYGAPLVGLKTVVPDTTADGDFDPDTMVKAADAVLPSGDLAPEGTVLIQRAAIPEVPAKYAKDEGQWPADSKVVVSDATDPVGANEIKLSEANANGGSYVEGDHVMVTPEVPAKPGTGLTGRVEEIEQLLEDFDPEKEDTSDALKALMAKVGLYSDETGKTVTMPEHFEASTDGTGLTVVADDADPFDEVTQVRVSDANKLGDNFQPGEKVMVVPAQDLGSPTGICKQLEDILEVLGKKAEVKEQVVPGVYVVATDGVGLTVVADDYEKDATYVAAGSPADDGALEVVADGMVTDEATQIAESDAKLTTGGTANIGEFVKLDVPAVVLDPLTQIKDSDAVDADDNKLGVGKVVKPATEEVKIPGEGIIGDVEELQDCCEEVRDVIGKHKVVETKPAYFEVAPDGALTVVADDYEKPATYRVDGAGELTVVADGTVTDPATQIAESDAKLTAGGNATVGQKVTVDVPAVVLDPATQVKTSDALGSDGNPIPAGNKVNRVPEEEVIKEPGTGLCGDVDDLKDALEGMTDFDDRITALEDKTGEFTTKKTVTIPDHYIIDPAGALEVVADAAFNNPLTQVKESEAVDADGQPISAGTRVSLVPEHTEEVVDEPATGMCKDIEELKEVVGEHGVVETITTHYELSNKPDALTVVANDADPFDKATMVKVADAIDGEGDPLPLGAKVELVEEHEEVLGGNGLAGEVDEVKNTIGVRSEVLAKGGYRLFDAMSDDAGKALTVILDGVAAGEGQINLSEVKLKAKPGVDPNTITVGGKVVLDEDVIDPASGIMGDIEDVENKNADQDDTLDDHEERIAKVEEALKSVKPTLQVEVKQPTLYKLGDTIAAGTEMFTIKVDTSKEDPESVTATGCTVVDNGDGTWTATLANPMTATTELKVGMKVDGYDLEKATTFKFVAPIQVGAVVTAKAIPEHYETYLGYGAYLTVIPDATYQASTDLDAVTVVDDDYDRPEAYVGCQAGDGGALQVVTDGSLTNAGTQVEVSTVVNTNTAANVTVGSDKYTTSVSAGAYVLHQDARTIDLNTQVYKTVANQFGGTFQAGDKVKLIATTPNTDTEIRVGDVNSANNAVNTSLGEVKFKDNYKVGDMVVKVSAYDPTSAVTERMEDIVVDVESLEGPLERPVTITVPSVVCIKYINTLPDLKNITDWQGSSLSLMNAFTRTTEIVNVAGTNYTYKVYTMKMPVVITDRFYFHFK